MRHSIDHPGHAKAPTAKRGVAGCLVILILGWVFVGEKISLFIDRLKTIPIASLSVTPLVFEELGTPGSIQIGSLPMSTGMPNYKRFPLQLTANASQYLVLLSNGKSFVLGPIASGGGTSGSGIAFSPEDGDKVSFVTGRSFLSWLTPFDFNFMTGQSPSWKRHLYYRFTWIKPSGAKLEMLWRYEQYFYPTNGWSSGFMTRGGITGLLRVEIRP